MSTFNELLELVLEKKSTADYRREKFLKKHKYNSNTSSIEMDGKRFRFHYLGGSNKHTSLPDGGARAPKPGKPSTGGMTMNRAAFNMRHPKSHESVASHELGHMMDNSIGHNNEKDELKQDVYDIIRPKVEGLKSKHGRRPQEYVADAVAYQRSGKKAFNSSMKQTEKTVNKRCKRGLMSKEKRDSLNEEFRTRRKLAPVISKDTEFNKHLENMKDIKFPGVKEKEKT